MFQVFDGHNDLLARLAGMDDPAQAWPGDAQAPIGHLDLHRMRAGGFVGGFFAIWCASPVEIPYPTPDPVTGAYARDLPPPLPFADAAHAALRQASMLHWMARHSDGALRICTTGADLRAAIAAGQVGAILHMEGAEPIEADLSTLDTWYAAGLRSLGPVWSRPNAFGHGVPLNYPATPDIGPGLTPAGQDLVRACDRLGVMIDLSHLNEAGFNDVARLSSRPLVATHSNAHAICPVPRNLTDRQLAMIAESDGMVGLNFATFFLGATAQHDPDLGWDVMMRHLDHLITHLGETRVGFGSDFDGAQVPRRIQDARGLQSLCQAMIDHGFGQDLTAKIAGENWLAFLDRTLT